MPSSDYKKSSIGSTPKKRLTRSQKTLIWIPKSHGAIKVCYLSERFFSMRISSNPAGFTKGAVPAAEGKKGESAEFWFFRMVLRFRNLHFRRVASHDAWSKGSALKSKHNLLQDVRGTRHLTKKWILVSAWKKTVFSQHVSRWCYAKRPVSHQ